MTTKCQSTDRTGKKLLAFRLVFQPHTSTGACVALRFFFNKSDSEPSLKLKTSESPIGAESSVEKVFSPKMRETKCDFFC